MDVSSTMELPMDGMYPNAQYPEDDYVDDDIENLVRKIVIQRRPRLNYWFKVSASSSVSLCLASLAPTPALPPPGSHHDEPRSHHRTRHHAVRLPTAPQHAMPSSQPLASPLGRPPRSAPRAPPFSSSPASSCSLDTSRAPSLLASRPTPHPTPRRHTTVRSHTHRSHNHPTPPPHRISTSSTQGVSRRVSSSARCTCRR